MTNASILATDCRAIHAAAAVAKLAGGDFIAVYRAAEKEAAKRAAKWWMSGDAAEDRIMSQAMIAASHSSRIGWAARAAR